MLNVKSLLVIIACCILLATASCKKRKKYVPKYKNEPQVKIIRDDARDIIESTK